VEKSDLKRKRGVGEGVDDITAISGISSPPVKLKKEEEDQKLSLTSLLQSRTTCVGFVDPVGDFHRMLEREDDVVDVAIREMMSCIRQLVRESVHDQQYPKAAECVVALRMACITQAEPEAFNQFLREFRSESSEVNRGRSEFWGLLQSMCVTLISSDETTVSTVLPDEARQVRGKGRGKGERKGKGKGEKEGELKRSNERDLKERKRK
jgi:hypothetical protein